MQFLFVSPQLKTPHSSNKNGSPVASYKLRKQYPKVDASISNSWWVGWSYFKDHSNIPGSWRIWYTLWGQRLWEPIFQLNFNYWPGRQGHCEIDEKWALDHPWIASTRRISTCTWPVKQIKWTKKTTVFKQHANLLELTQMCISFLLSTGGWI